MAKAKPQTNTKAITSFFTEASSEPEDSVSEATVQHPPDLILKCIWQNRRFKLPDLINYLAGFNDRFFMTFDKEGITFKNMDTSHVALLEVLISERDFSSYVFNREDALQTVINMNDFHRKLKRFNTATDQISFFLDAKSFEKSRLKHTCKKINFETALLESSEYDEIPKVGEIDYNSKINVDLFDLVEILEFASDHIDYINVKSNDRVITFHGESSDETVLSRSFKADDNASLSKAHSMYSLEYLLDMLKITSKAGLKKFKVHLEFSTANPLRLTVKITQHSWITGILSPRVEEDLDRDEMYQVLNKILKVFLLPLAD